MRHDRGTRALGAAGSRPGAVPERTPADGPKSDSPTPPGFEFSLTRGGPLYRLSMALIVHGAPVGPVGLGGVLALVTWVPMLILSIAQRDAVGNVTVPFVAAISPHAHYLVALPLLFLAEVWIDGRLAAWLAQLTRSQVVPAAQHSAFHAAIHAAARWRDAWVPEALLLVVAIALLAAGIDLDLPNKISSWETVTVGGAIRLTPAGWWAAAVAQPIYRFLVLRWLWRLVIWSMLLWRLSRLDLQLVPTHPDLAGGLGGLGTAASHFSVLCVALWTPFAGGFAERMLFAGATLREIQSHVMGIVLLSLLLFVGPLLVFSPRLLAAKQRGLRDYGIFAAEYTRGFDARWVGEPHGSPLGTPDLQSLADLSNSFAVVRSMRVVPFGPVLITVLVAATLAPMLPLLLIAYPITTLMQWVLKTLVGGPG